MTSRGKDFQGHIQAGGQQSAAPWVEATVSMLGNEVVVLVNQTEVARLSGPSMTDTGQNNVYLIEGADQPLFFRPIDPAGFREAVAPPMTTAERIAAATAQPQDATMVMDSVPSGEPPPESDVDAGEEQSSSRWWLIALGIGLVVIVLLIAFCGGDEEAGTSSTTTLLGATTTASDTTVTSLSPTTTTAAETTSTAPTDTTAPASTTTAAPTTTVPEPEPAFGAGTHVVGDDVQPGVYETGIVGLRGCYWERLSGLSGEFDDIITNGNVSNHDVVEIIEGDAAFSTDCDAWYPLTELDPLLTAIPEGKWVLGTHIFPGTYEAPGGDSCYWERLSGLSGTTDDIIANDLPSGQAIVEIADNDVAFNSNGCGEWTSGP